MKKLLVFLSLSIICFSTLAFANEGHKQDKQEIIKDIAFTLDLQKTLVGTWKSLMIVSYNRWYGNITFNDDGTFIYKRVSEPEDNGEDMVGTWRVDKNIVLEFSSCPLSIYGNLHVYIQRASATRIDGVGDIITIFEK